MTASDRRGFRNWRRTRPFWGGVFTVASGVEIILIPLAPSGVTIHQGIAGIGSWLAGALLITAGLLMWFQPQQRSFFGILAVLLALGSFVTSNLGGFLFGMLLGLLGGALGFAWAPRAADPAEGSPEDPGGPALSTRPSETESDAEITRSDLEIPRVDPGEGVAHRSGSRHLGLAVAPALLSAGLMGAPALHQDVTPMPSDPGPSAPPTPSATPTPSPTPTPPGKQGGESTCDPGTPDAGHTASPSPSTPGPDEDCKAPKDCPAPETASGLSNSEIAKEMAKAATCVKPGKVLDTASSQAPVATDPVTLKATSLTMSGLHYDGVVDMPTGDGTPVKMMRFHMGHVVIHHVDQSFGKGAARARLRAGTLTFDGGVVMYATKMSSKLFGILRLTFTPENPPPFVPSYLYMTDVISEQSSVSANSGSMEGLDLSV